MRPIIITGTGRSGTKWCATALRMGGILCGHEQVFDTANLPSMTKPTWGPFPADSSLAAAPFLPEYPNALKVLVTRDPYRTAASWAHNGSLLAGAGPRGLAPFLKAHCPQIYDAHSEMDAALQYWAYWNALCLPHADVVLKIEELDHPRDLFDRLHLRAKWPLFPLGEVNTSHVGDFDYTPVFIGPMADLIGELGYAT